MIDITEQLRVGFCTGISTVTLESAAKTIERLRSENENLRKALAEKVVSQTMLRELSAGNGSINAAFEGGAAHLLADAFADQFLESEATNYLEVHLHSAATGPLVVTLQRVNGKTPHQLRAEAEKERDALRAKIEAMEKQEPFGWLLDGDFYEVRQMNLYEDTEPLPGQTALYALPGAQSAQDLLLRSRVADLLHILQFAQIACQSAGDSEQAEVVMADIKRILGIVGTYGVEGYIQAQPAPSAPDVDALAQFIRSIDGKNDLGAGALAERIVEWLSAQGVLK